MRAQAMRFGITLLLLTLATFSFAGWQGLDEGFRVQYSSTDSIRLQWNSSNVVPAYIRYLQLATPAVDKQYAACYVAVPRGKVPSLIRYTGFNDTTVRLGDPTCMRDLWMVAVNIKLQNPTTAAGNDTSGVITIGFSTGANSPTALTRGVSTVFRPLYDALVPNFIDVTPTANQSLPPSLLFVVADTSFLAPLANLVNWKKSLGWKVTVADSATMGGKSVTAIHTYIQNAYNNWAAPPDAVYLIGNYANLPPQLVYTADPGTMWSAGSEGQPYPGNYCDENYFSRLDGPTWYTPVPDPMPDVLIGRMSVGTFLEVNDQVIKTVAYESRTDTASWSNHTVIGSDQQSQTQLDTKRWTRARMYESGVASVDSLFTSNSGQLLNGLLDAGRSIVNYRGQGWNTWWYGINYQYFDIANCNNFNKPTIITGIGCGVAKFDETICFGEYWMKRGSNLGAVGFMGPTWNTHTQFNNQIDIGLYRFWFHHKFSTFMLGMMAGKAQLLASMAANSPTDPSLREILRVACSQYIALSDPTMTIMVGVPQPLNVVAPTIVGYGTQSISFSVHNANDLTPMPNLLVSVYDTSGSLGAAWTDSTGSASVTANLGANPRYVHYAISGYHARVKIDSINVFNGTIQFDSVAVQNAGGMVAPGDTLRMQVMLTNTTNQNLSAITIQIDSMSNVLQPGTISEITQVNANQDQTLSGFTAVLSSNYRSAQPIRVHFSATVNNVVSGLHGYSIPVAYPVTAVDSLSFDPSGNSWLDRGESAPFVFTIHNESAIDLSQSTVHLLVNDSLIRFPVTQQNVSILPNSSLYIANAFTATASDSLPAYHPLHVDIVLQKTFPTYMYSDTTHAVLETGTIDSTGPSHAANVPYFAYESSDQNYSEIPTTDYIEISPSHGGNGFRIPFTSGNDADTINIPIIFRYFGHTYSKVTVCTDGWLAPTYADTVGNNPINDTLPNPNAPFGVIAPYWDNLFSPVVGGQNVFWYRDFSRRLFIIEWDSVCYANNSTDRMSFEVILYDAVFSSYVTPSGDSRIEFVYRNIPAGGTPTIGISSPDNQAGLTLQYNSTFAPTMHRTHTFPWVLRLTSEQPNFLDAVREQPGLQSAIPASFMLSGPYPNPFNPETRISVAIPNTMPLKIDLMNVQGQLVQRIVSTKASPGRYNYTIRGENLSSGEYFIMVTAGSNRMVRKMLLLR